MKIQIKRPTVAGGEARCVGDVVEVIDSDARYLIAIGKAEKYVAEPIKQFVSQPEKKAKKASK